MSPIFDMEKLTPPNTYEEWLKYFELLKSSSFVDEAVVMTITKGTFVDKGYIATQFNQQLVETINQALNKRISRFLKDLDLLISLNELSGMVPLFTKFRSEIRKCLFFTKLEFLDSSINEEIEQSVKNQMEQLWNDTVSFLQKQSLECSNTDLEDSLFLIRRIRLFE